MEADSWSRLFAASKRRQPALQSRYGLDCGPPDASLGFEEVERGEDDNRPEFVCPFCCEEFDLVGLFFHVEDDHPVETKNGICPVCSAGVGLDIVAHITTEHASIFKVPRRRRYHKGSSESYTTLSLSRKNIHEGNLRSFLGDSINPSNAAPDPLLSSFMFNSLEVDSSEDKQLEPTDEDLVDQISDNKLVESAEPSEREDDLGESAQRSQFVRQLVLSTIFDDAL